MKKLTSLSVFFPAYNDAKILPYLVTRSHKVASKITSDFEIIVIDDSSTDNTREILVELKKRYSNLRFIHHKKNLGYGAALISGFRSATKEWVFYTDGDGQYDPNELLLLVKQLKEEVDVVNGYKLHRSDNILRKAIGSSYNIILHVLYDLPISDVDCDFRLVRRSLLNKISLTSSSGIICLELIIKLKKAGAHFAEVGVHHYKRPFGHSQFFKPKHVAKTIYDNVTYVMKSKF